MGNWPRLVGTLFLLMDLFAYVVLGGVFSLSIVVCFCNPFHYLQKDIRDHGNLLLPNPSLQQLSSIKLWPTRGMRFNLLQLSQDFKK
jgi:hypothetical protein